MEDEILTEIRELIMQCDDEAKTKGSRELSLVKTKLEEAEMWRQKCQ